MDVLTRPADEFDNDALVEEMWAAKAFEHAQVYFNILCSVDPRGLRLTPYDSEIYAAFRHEFPHLNVDRLNEDELKTPEAKQRWRAFIEKFNKLEDYSFGTIVRANAGEDFQPENSILVIRLQFWAIEIARNREGYNDQLREKYQATQAAVEPETVAAAADAANVESGDVDD